MKWRSCCVAPGAVLGTFLLFASVATGQEAEKRTVRGQVLDENEKVVANAIVHLVNRTTKVQLSVVTDKEGRYQFNSVDPKADYQLYAEHKERRSRTRNLSQLDPRSLITLNLQLNAAPLEKADEQEEKKGES